MNAGGVRQELKRVWNLATLGLRARRMRRELGTTPSDVVHAENKWKLLRYRPRPEGLAFRTPILLVPSLINRHYVLDLQKGKSFAEYLVGRGHDVSIIDWGTPGPEDRFLTFDDVCDGYLGRAVRKTAAFGDGKGKAHLLGYCLGGTFAAIHAAARPAHVASLTAIAAPVRFQDGGLLSAWMRSPALDIARVVDAFGNMPWPLMQASFLLLRPTLGLSKAVHLLDRAWDDRHLDGFFALETWGNDNVSFPGECFKQYAEELYRKDALVNGRFRLSGRPALLSSIECPTLAVTFEHDNIVPWQSAAELLDQIASRDKQRIHLPGGHVGAMVSRKAADTLWPQLSEWWATRDAKPLAAPRTGKPHLSVARRRAA